MQECLRQHRAGWLTTLRPCTGNAVGNIVNEMNKRMLQLTDTCTSQMLATQARLEAVVVPDACAPLPPLSPRSGVDGARLTPVHACQTHRPTATATPPRS